MFINHLITPTDSHTFMNPTNGLLQWTDLLSVRIALNSIGDLNTTSGNYHTYCYIMLMNVSLYFMTFT